MAQEIRIQRRSTRPATARPVLREPETTDEARGAIEEARRRISATMDAIEDRIEETREEIEERIDVLRPLRARVRANPLPGLGIAFGTGLVLGLLTGGGEARERKRRRRTLGKEKREERKRWRAERRERLGGRRVRSEPRGEPTLLGQLGGAVATAVLAGLAARVRRTATGEPTRGQA